MKLYSVNNLFGSFNEVFLMGKRNGKTHENRTTSPFHSKFSGPAFALA